MQDQLGLLIDQFLLRRHPQHLTSAGVLQRPTELAILLRNEIGGLRLRTARSAENLLAWFGRMGDMLSTAYPLHTLRLRLRPFTSGDVDDAFAYQSREDVCRYIPYPPRTRERVAERTAHPHARSTIEKPGDALLLAVQLRQAGPVIGDVMLYWAVTCRISWLGLV